MDLWVVAAATGAGYVAKYWRNLTSAETSSEVFSFDSIHRQSDSRNLLQQIRDQTNPLRRLAGKQDRDGLFLDEQQDLIRVRNTHNSHSQRQLEYYENYNLLSLTSFSPVLTDNENFRVIGNGMERKSNFSNISEHLRSRYHGNYLEPLDSIDSSLRAQLYMEYVAIEENEYNSLPSQTTTAVRPLLLTDGRPIISRSSSDFRAEHETSSLSRKLKMDTRRWSRRFSMMMESVQPFHSQGFANAKLLFFLGVSVGIMSSILANNSQVENLNELLKKNDNFVEDLQEELQMKDLLNVKEFPHEDVESFGTNERQLLSGTPYALYHEQELDGHRERDSKETADHKAESSEAMSKIEAELVAELERLELNMRKSSFERISDYVELDPDFAPDDIVQGDLKLDKAIGEQNRVYDNRDSDISRTSSDHTDETDYAVSPQELSLRIHEVIQSRLEARIMELKRALENSQKRLHTLELESITPWRDLYGEGESFSQESQTFIDEDYNDNDSWS